MLVLEILNGSLNQYTRSKTLNNLCCSMFEIHIEINIFLTVFNIEKFSFSFRCFFYSSQLSWHVRLTLSPLGVPPQHIPSNPAFNNDI